MTSRGGGLVAILTALSLDGCATARPEQATARAVSNEAKCDAERSAAARAMAEEAAGRPATARRADVERRVEKLLVEHLRISPQLAVNSPDLICDAKADSLDMVEIVMAVEEEFGFDIPDEDADRDIRNFRQIVSYIEGRLQQEERA
jgi:acyl carrier protein